MKQQTFLWLGLSFIIAGIVFNEWFITIIFSPDGMINALGIKIRIIVLEILLFLIGFILITCRHRIACDDKYSPYTIFLLIFGVTLIILGIIIDENILGRFYCFDTTIQASILDVIAILLGATIILSVITKTNITKEDNFQNRLYQILTIIAIIIYLYQSLIRYIGAGHDDTFISLWAGKALSNGSGLVNYNYESIEISSSFLHTLIIACINVISSDSVFFINKLCGMFVGLFVLMVIYFKRFLLIPENQNKFVIFVLIILTLANYPFWLYWNMGGLETPYQTLLLFLYGVYLLKYWHTSQGTIPLAIIQIFYILVRPEGFILLFYTMIFVLICFYLKKVLQKKQIMLFIGIPVLVFLITIFLRYAMFGVFFPNPVYAKVGGNAFDRISIFYKGVKYIIDFYISSPFMMLQGILLLFICCDYLRKIFVRFNSMNSQTFPYLFWVGLILMNHLFIFGVGGDWMAYFRFIVPITPFLIIVTTLFGVNWLSLFYHRVFSQKMVTKISVWIGIAIGSAVLLFIIMAYLLLSDSKNVYNCSPRENIEKLKKIKIFSSSLYEVNKIIMLMGYGPTRDYNDMMPFILERLPQYYEHFHHELKIVTYQMGFIPYHIKQIYPLLNITFIDTMGLCDKNVAQLPYAKNTVGVVGGAEIDKIVTNRAGVLSKYVLTKEPNMIYMLEANKESRKLLKCHGWNLVWDKPEAVIFIKDKLQSGSIDCL